MASQTKYATIPDLEADESAIYPVKPKKSSRLASPQSLSSKKNCSCLKWTLCVVLFVVVSFLALSVAAVAGIYNLISQQVVRFSVVDPKELPVFDLPSADLELVKDRAKLFMDTLDAGKVPADDLTLTVDEINGFIAHSDYLRGNAWVSMDQDDKVVFDMSLPMAVLPGGAGRFFVASSFIEMSPDHSEVTVDLETDDQVGDLDGPFLLAHFHTYWDTSDDKLIVNLLDGVFADHVAPQDWIDSKENLVESLYDCDDATRIIQGIEDVSFQNGTVTLKARRNSAGSGDKPVSDSVPKTTSAYSHMHTGGRLLRKLLF